MPRLSCARSSEHKRSSFSRSAHCTTSLIAVVVASVMLFSAVGIASAAAATSLAPRVSPHVLGSTGSEVIVAATRSVADSCTFCTDAVNSAKSSVSPAPTATVTSLEDAFKRLKAAEPYILAHAPTAITGDYETVFNYFNKFYGLLEAVGYKFQKLTPSKLASLESGIAKVKAASEAIAAYVKKQCRVSLP